MNKALFNTLFNHLPQVNVRRQMNGRSAASEELATVPMHLVRQLCTPVRHAMNPKEQNMHKSVIALGAVAAMSLFGLHSASAAPVGAVGSPAAFDQATIQLAQYWRGGYCARLRRACEFKYERGEVGEGNCRRYRQECGGRASYCERLRRACFNKDVRGEVGQGNCRRYRAECGGRFGSR
jgi:hypothetical protein